MRWLRAFVIGVVTAIVAYLFALIVGSIVMEARGMGDYEGERAIYVGLAVAPFALLGGFIAGIAFGARAGHGAGFFFRQLGLAVAMSCAIICAVGIVGYTTRDKPPTIDDRRIEVEFEVRVPASSGLPDDLKAAQFTASLNASDRDSRFATLQFDATRTESGARVIPGVAGLHTHSDHRRMFVGTFPSQSFELPLAATPPVAQNGWSEWLAPTTFVDGAPIPDAEKFALRYQVRFAK